ncbi:NAD-dependent epimerase/dehydratase family protein, partial [Candidatus Pelagibacter bacterium]|nr:NAD-dependent epimerase/dehydratase family protein [Candidatus Pelagibacter bacterium]
MKILITGASGYIGSILLNYLSKDFLTIGLDKKKPKKIQNIKCDLTDKKKVFLLLKKIMPDLIVHLAGQSLVDETISKKKYYYNNVIATKNLIEAMKCNRLNNIIFSSTAAVYKYKNGKLNEESKIKAKSTYAKTKLECEKIIKKSKINSIILRFFNVCSSLNHNKKIMGEFHNPETHLIPTAVYKNILKKKIYVYGNNYNTKDGTCIRDYIHIKDICDSINKSIKYLHAKNNQFEIINIGSNYTYTIHEILQKIEKITKIKNKIDIVKRRTGDADKLTCSIKKAKNLIKWKPINSNIEKILKDE